MSKFSLDLPFFVPMHDGPHALNIDGREFMLSTEAVRQESLDSRLGGVEGNFGFERDQMGLLRFTRMEAVLSEDDLPALDRILGGGRFVSRGTSCVNTQAELVLMLFNHFLERYRVATRKPDIRPIGQWDLASMRVEDEDNFRTIRLYGGGITLPVAGLAPKDQAQVEQSLAVPDGPSAYELGALQALYALDNGTPSEAILLAAGSLELATDTYLARSCRISTPAGELKSAAKLIGVRYDKGMRTVDDILEAGSISKKLKSKPITEFVGAAGATARLEDALEVRNLVAHSGVRILTHEASRHVHAMTSVVLDILAPAIRHRFPRLPRQDFLYAYEEALGNEYLSQLENVADIYLGAAGLTAKLYNHKAKRENMFSDRYGDAIVMRIAVADFEKEQITLFVGRSILHHWIQAQGTVAFARAAPTLPDKATRPFWTAVASDLTRAVRGVAIDFKLTELGLGEVLARDVKRQVSLLRRRYDDAYTSPKFEQIEFWTDYLTLSRTAVMLPPSERNQLLAQCSKIAPRVVSQARQAITGLGTARLDDFSSILNAMVATHDAHGSLLGTVPVHDPISRRDYGIGLRFEDLSNIVEQESE